MDISQSVADTIHQLEEILAEYDPLHLISIVSKINLVKNPETFSESADIHSEPLVEYLMSLALSKSYPTSPKVPTGRVVQNVLDLWTDLSSNLVSHFGSELLDAGNDSIEAQIRFKLILDYHLVRGAAYASHIEQTFLELFEGHSSHLLETIGFSAQELHDFLQFSEEQISLGINQEFDAFRDLFMKSFEPFIEMIKDGTREDANIVDFMKRIKTENPELTEDQSKIGQFLETYGSYEVFEIAPRNQTYTTILESLSCEFGDNEDFLKPDKWRAWPTNDTILSERPIIKFGGRYYLFHLPLLSRTRISLLENILESNTPRYYNDRYLPSRDRYVEKQALELIKTLLPTPKTYSNLYYYVKEDGQEKRVELDGLILFDDCLLIIESKAGLLPRSARRGSIRRLKDNLKDNLKKAHSQASRAFSYIRSHPVVPFLDENGAEVVSVEREQFKDIFLVLVNFEPLYVLSSHLSSAKQLDLLVGKEWPWFVYLNDLRVIAEILDCPSLFLHYLKRRIRLNDHSQVVAFDELDYFMYYLKTGLYFTKEELVQADLLVVSAYTYELDAYYSWLRGERSEVAKPKMHIHPTLQLLISRLETEKPRHFVSACLHLLNGGEETRTAIAEGIKICEMRFKKEKKLNSISLRINGTGLLLGCMKNIAKNKSIIDNWGNKWLRDMDVDRATVICWEPPIKKGKIRVFLFSK
ncbi:MAG: hypothetical protein ACFFFC_16800 [Candidatus Thorarchaeota archaeon]